MKIKFYSILFLSLFCLSQQRVSAQVDAVAFLKSGASDANKLVNGYMKPLFDGFGASMNNGWYNTARPHGIGGFDVTATFSLVNLSDNLKTYDASKLGLNTDPANARIVPASGSLGLSPTVYGSSEVNGTKLNVVQRLIPGNPASDTVVSSFDLPPGSGAPYGIGLPNVQFAVGVGFGTELMLRVTPTLTAGDFKVKMFGFGVKHSISQWIWKGNDKPPVDLSVVFGYNKISADYGFGDNYLKPDSAYAHALPDADYKNSQKITFDCRGMTFGALVSKKLSLLTIYAGATYNSSNVQMKMAGKYPVTFVETTPGDPNFGQKIILNMSDPIDIKSDLSFMKLTGGVRIKLAILTLSGEYNIGKVSTMSLGVGINLQSIKPFKL